MHVRALLVVSLLAAGCGDPFARQPVTGPTPVTTGELELFVQNAQGMGCVSGKMNDGVTPYVECNGEPGKPRYAFHKDNTVTCIVYKRYVDQCPVTWAKLNANP
jgi:hypothetical protein